ncbi:MAG TPA: TIR domain-containing protein [Solirubrobacteraceae bacterium]|nr:TIR domain-containing protein [Solirubrobacteraceae bacterium]
MADVFISYAHEDLAFVERLRGALEERGREVWSDHDIEPADRWKRSADEAIDRSDTVVFVISVASLRSEPCRGELSYAQAAHKRLIAVCVEEAAADVADKPPEVAELSWIMMRPGDDFDAGVERVLHALDTDVESVREHTRILVRARAWDLAGRRPSPLLRGDELRTAEDWLSRSGSAGVRPTELHIEFIRASRGAAVRRQRTIAAVSVAVAAVAIVLSIFALVERASAVHQASISRSGDLSAESADTAAYGARVSALLALQAYDTSPTTQARGALVGAAEQPLLRASLPGAGEINGLAAGPGGRLVAAAGPRAVLVWNPASGRTVARIGTRSRVNAVAWSPDGTLIAAALDDGRVAVYRLSDRRLLYSAPGDGSHVNGVAFDPASRTAPVIAYVTQDGDLYLRNLATRGESHATLRQTDLLAVAFDHGGARLAVAGGSEAAANAGVLLVYHLGAAGSPQSFPAVASSQGVSSVAFARSGTLAAAGDNGDLYLIDTASGVVRKVAAGPVLNVVRFDPSGSLVATGSAGGAVQLWNAATGAQVGETMQTGTVVYGLAFADAGRALVSAGFQGGLQSWTPSGTPPLERTIASRARTGGIDEVAINAAGTLIATANDNFTATVWRRSSLAAVHQLSAAPAEVATVAFEPSGDVFAMALTNGDVLLENAASGRRVGIARLPHGQAPSPVSNLAFGPGSLMATGSVDGDVDLWSLARGRPRLLAKLTKYGRGRHVTALAFDPAGGLLAAAYTGTGIDLYSLADDGRTEHGIRVSEELWSLAFVDGGAEVAAGDNEGAVEIFDVATGAPEGGLPGTGQPVYGLALSPDGRTLATSDAAGRVRLWDLASGLELGAPLITGTGTYSLAFAPDGGALVTGDRSGAIDILPPLLWSQDGAGFAHYLCAHAGANLTAAQWSELDAGQSGPAPCARLAGGG